MAAKSGNLTKMPILKTTPKQPMPECSGPVHEPLKEIALRLLEYCRKNDWAGYDPYDALNSKVFKALPFLDFKAARLVLTQGVKRSPINLRPLLLVPKTQNPKGIALFLSALVKLTRSELIEGDMAICMMADKLLALKSTNIHYSCWGYSFDWQTRGDLVPKGTPNIICSTFAGNALLDAYEISKESLWLDAAKSAATFILDLLFWQDQRSIACFSYTPLGRSEVHNANLLGAAFLCRVSKASGENKFVEPALDAARYSVGKQHEDGSWFYGESPHQEWIDNFHTGFNLIALRKINQYCGTEEFGSAIRSGFDFYKNHFFRNDGAPKYYHNGTYPIDIHSVAQSIKTLIELSDLSEENVKLAYSVLKWARENMWDVRGFFYFQKMPYYKVRTPFMRWSQAWMLFALATLLEKLPLANREGRVN